MIGSTKGVTGKVFLDAGENLHPTSSNGDASKLQPSDETIGLKIIGPKLSELGTCSICLEDIKPHHNLQETIILPCKHPLHLSCINEIVKHSFQQRLEKREDSPELPVFPDLRCPICRDSLDEHSDTPQHQSIELLNYFYLINNDCDQIDELTNQFTDKIKSSQQNTGQTLGEEFWRSLDAWDVHDYCILIEQAVNNIGEALKVNHRISASSSKQDNLQSRSFSILLREHKKHYTDLATLLEKAQPFRTTTHENELTATKHWPIPCERLAKLPEEVMSLNQQIDLSVKQLLKAISYRENAELMSGDMSPSILIKSNDG